MRKNLQALPFKSAVIERTGLMASNWLNWLRELFDRVKTIESDFGQGRQL